MSITEEPTGASLPLLRNWTHPPAQPDLPTGGTPHLWRIDLRPPPGDLTALLADDEQQRLRALRRHGAGDRFARGRGALRRILAGYLGLPAADLAFDYGPLGRPSLPVGRGRLDFNLSHAGDMALLAVSDGAAIGVDLERSGERHDLLRIARRLFSAADYRRFSALPARQRPAAFLRHWTALEAYAKARGNGVFSSDPSGLWLTHFHPAGGWLAALALASRPAPIEHWRCYRFD